MGLWTRVDFTLHNTIQPDLTWLELAWYNRHAVSRYLDSTWWIRDELIWLDRAWLDCHSTAMGLGWVDEGSIINHQWLGWWMDDQQQEQQQHEQQHKRRVAPPYIPFILHDSCISVSRLAMPLFIGPFLLFRYPFMHGRGKETFSISSHPISNWLLSSLASLAHFPPPVCTLLSSLLAACHLLPMPPVWLVSTFLFFPLLSSLVLLSSTTTWTPFTLTCLAFISFNYNSHTMTWPPLATCHASCFTWHSIA